MITEKAPFPLLPRPLTPACCRDSCLGAAQPLPSLPVSHCVRNANCVLLRPNPWRTSREAGARVEISRLSLPEPYLLSHFGSVSYLCDFSDGSQT